MGTRMVGHQLKGPVFVGRSDDLAAIMKRVTAADEGRAGVVWIGGEAGSGKSALLRAVIERLPERFQVLRAEADELARDTPSGVVSQFARIDAPDGFGAGLELLDFLGRAQDDGPVAVVVEDLHWADRLSREALLTVARRLHDDRVVMVVTSRPGNATDGWERLVVDPERCLPIEVTPLTAEEVATLAEGSGRPLTTDQARRLHRHTKGHALYVRTLLAELTPAQLAAPDGELPAPHSLASTTVAVMADLPTAAQGLGSALAVLNQRVPLEVAGRVASVDDPTTALDHLLGTGFVSWSPSQVGTPVEFVHPLYRAAIYDDLSPTRRQHLHRAAAAVLDPTAALTHRVAAAEHGDEVLVDELVEVARSEEAAGADGLSARHLAWAASLTGVTERTESFRLDAARLLLRDGQIARVEASRDELEAGAPRPLRNLVLGRLAFECGHAVDAEAWLGGAEAVAGHDDSDDRAVAAALGHLGIVYVTSSRAQEAVDTAERVLAMEPTDRATERLGWIALGLGRGMLEGAPAGLDQMAERLDADPSLVAPEDADLLITRATLGFYAGRTTQATADLRAAISLARQGQGLTQLPRAHMHLAQLLVSSGDWDEALVQARVARSLVAIDRDVWMEAQVHAVLGTVLAGRGHWAAATDEAEAGEAAAEALGTIEGLYTTRIARAALARAGPDPAGVIDALGPLAGSGRSGDLPMFTSLGWWPTLIQARIDAGQVDLAAEQADQLREAARDRGLDFAARIKGLEARIAAARGDSERAEAGFAQAIAAFGPDDPFLDRALLHHAAGRVLLARGSRDGATTQLSLARDQLDRVGAEPYRSRVEADLASIGLVHGKQPARSSLDLTDRERDVAALVANGLTNKEVAAELYVSTKAVEYHLTNIFGKLGIRSRRELRGHEFA